MISSKYFFKPMLILSGGSALGHLITAIALPIATRLYSPEDFTILSAFTAITSLIAVIACLRYEVAIPIAESKKEASVLLYISVLSICVFILISFLAIQLAGSSVLTSLRLDYISGYKYMIPISIAALSLFNVMLYWHLYEGEFNYISTVNIVRSLSLCLAQILLGFMAFGPLGLLIAYILNSGVGLLFFVWKFLKKFKFSRITKQTLKTTAKKYIKFPKYSTYEALFNTASMQAPVLIIASFGIGPEAGFLMISVYVMQVPMLLIGNSAGQVYYAKAANEYKNGNLGSFNLHVIEKLSYTGIGPIIFIGIVSPNIFSLVFGEGWDRAGEMVQFMTPWFLLQFLTSPLSPSFLVTGNQKRALQLQLFGFIFRTFTVIFAMFAYPILMVEFYAFSGFIFYFIYLICILSLSSVSLEDLIKSLFIKWWIMIGWAILGFGIINLTELII